MYAVHLVGHEVALGVERQRKEDAFGVHNLGVVEQRRVQGILDSLLHTVHPLPQSGADDGHTAILQRLLHIGKVDVDGAVLADNLHDAARGHGERVVGHGERVEQLLSGIDGAQAFIVHNHQRVDILAYGVHAVERLKNLGTTLEHKGNRHDADGEDAHLLGHARHHGAGSRAGAAAHTGRDEHHLRAVVEQFAYVLNAFFGRLLGLLRVVARAQSLSDARAQLQLHGDGRVSQRLVVGVAKGEGHALDALAIHVADGVSSTASHAYHFDDALVVIVQCHKRHYVICHSI